jgi:hypothetical protein
MRGNRPAALRRALAPLGAMLAIGLTAGYLIGRDVIAHQTPAELSPSVTTASPEHGASPSAETTHATTSDGAAGQRSAARLAGTTPGRAASTRATYKFLLTQPDQATPIRWNPCEPIHYKVALGDVVPASEIPNVRDAFDAVGTALGGVTFLYDGTTDVVPDTIDGSSAADTDLVFAFATAGKGAGGSDLLTGWEAGRGGMAASGAPGPDGSMTQRPTHGSVVLDVAKWQVMNRHERAVLYLHEIGHAAGLDHPSDTRQIMSSGAYDLPARYQAGDLAGFAALGRQAGCTR